MKITIEVPSAIPRLLTPNRSRKALPGHIGRVKKELQLAAFYAAVDAKNRWLVEHQKGDLPFKKGLTFNSL